LRKILIKTYLKVIKINTVFVTEAIREEAVIEKGRASTLQFSRGGEDSRACTKYFTPLARPVGEDSGELAPPPTPPNARVLYSMSLSLPR
jgi:hypothetical protein